jgi:ABC-2 type transport system ATP-binding protein
VLEKAGLTIAAQEAETLHVTGAELGRIGALAFGIGAQIDELAFRRASLEQAYMELTGASVEYGAVARESVGIEYRGA